MIAMIKILEISLTVIMRKLKMLLMKRATTRALKNGVNYLVTNLEF